MIPEKDKKYAIACMGPYDYNRWAGVATYTGQFQEHEEPYYAFEINGNITWFIDEDIIAEVK